MCEIKEKVIKIVSERLDIDEEEISDTSSFVEDLGADSLDQVELVMAFEEEFNIAVPDSDAEEVLTVGEAITYLKKVTKNGEIS